MLTQFLEIIYVFIMFKWFMLGMQGCRQSVRIRSENKIAEKEQRMSRSTLSWAVIIGIIILGSNVAFGIFSAIPSSTSDGRSLEWKRFDVLIDNIQTSENRFDVTETYQLAIDQGPFSFGTRDIPMDRLTGITNVSITDGSTALREQCVDWAGSFCTSVVDDFFTIKYYFSSQAQSGTTRTIRIKYTVYGALRAYPDEGDQLYWVALPEERPFPIRATTVTVNLPEGRPALAATSYPDNWKLTRNEAKTTLTWNSPGDLGTGDIVEVRVKYPADTRMDEPPWQNAFDIQRAYEDDYQPVVTLLLLAFALAIAISGVLFVGLRYMRFGRDPKALVVPEYLTEPPSDEHPGTVGALLDEKVDMQDIMSTLVDLARRGYFTIEQTSTGGVLGMFEKSDFTFHRSDKSSSELGGFERTLLKGLFPSDKGSTTLTDLRYKFYTYIPAIKQQMYADLVAKEYFKANPNNTRQTWFWLGIVLMVAGSLLFWGAQRSLTWISGAIVTLPVAIGIVGFAATLAADYMPGKTLKGSQDAARWRAFKRYLSNIDKYGDVAEANAKFDQYIAYAIAMGIDQELTRKMAPLLTAMPDWYFPTYVGGPWHGGYHERRYGRNIPASMGDRSVDLPNFSGPGGLNEMSRSLTEGLNGMSSGLTRMLNDASSVMTSRPSSSGKSGGFGGGFSGGGRGGGGGSGGGRAGFG